MKGPSRTAADRLAWYARRLQVMTPAEVGWRGLRLVAERTPRRSLVDAPDARLLGPAGGWERVLADFRAARNRPLLLDRNRARALAAEHPDQVAALVAAARRVRDGRVTYFGYPEATLGRPVDWNADPVRGVRWPLRDAARLDHRSAPADPKWIWELNRLQHLPWLAEAWLFTGDEGFAELALEHLDSWLEQNPVGRGIAWRGAFEAGVRAISVAVALQGLRDFPGLTPARFERAARVLAASAERCWRDRSRHSSANNHLVGELAGLAAVALLLPELAPAAHWRERAVRGLAAEAARQILPDGAGAEQAVGYQVFTAELLLVVALLVQAGGEVPPAALLAAVDRSADHLAAVVGDADPDPRHGDDDEGFALRLGPAPRRTVREHLGLVAALTGNPRAARAATDSLDASWIRTVPGRPAGAPGSAPPPPAGHVAPDGGLVVLRSGGRRVTMDIAPLGYLAIAAHGHADALAVTVSLDGADVIGHPGAASYYGHPGWRSVHRSTRAHPTVTVDGEDQSVPGGPFLWTRHARVQVRAVDADRGVVDAEHDGYRRLRQPVVHRRWLLAPPDEPAVLVVDEVSGEGVHEVRTSWPVHPDLDAEPTGRGHLLRRDGRPVLQVVTAAAPAGETWQLRGDEAAGLGWWSHRLESREPAWLVGYRTRGAVPVVVATVLAAAGSGGGPVTDVGVAVDGDRVTVSWTSGGRHREAVVDRSAPGAVRYGSLAGGGWTPPAG